MSYSKQTKQTWVKCALLRMPDGLLVPHPTLTALLSPPQTGQFSHIIPAIRKNIRSRQMELGNFSSVSKISF